MKMWPVRKRVSLSAISYICCSGTVIFLVANLSLLNSRLTSSNIHPGYERENVEETRREIKLAENAWKFLQPQIPETRLRKLLQNSLEKDRTSIPYSDNTEKWINCEEILRNSSSKEFLASGWTKAVYRTKIHGKHVALKTVDVTGHDVSKCQETGRSTTECYALSAQKIVKEIVFLQGVSHENIVKVLGYCVPTKPYTGNEDSLVVMVTELGEPVDIIRLLQMSWEDRLRITLDISKLINFMAESPYGSLSMNDFRRQQFVLTDGTLKLTDVDDVGFDEPSCETDKQCEVFHSSSNFTLRSQCKEGACENHNEKVNIYNAGRHFTTFILPHGAPTKLRPMVDSIIRGFSDVTMTSSELLDKITELVDHYKSGRHLNRTALKDDQTEFIRHENTDLPGIHDYKCPYTASSSDCTVSVFDIREAELVCANDPACRGFILSPKKTWTGRRIVHLKNSITSSVSKMGTTLYVKPTKRL